MFGLDFDKLHNHLFPRSYDDVTGMPLGGKGVPAVPLVNPKAPRSGVHLCRETIFTAGSLAFICYVKNLFSANSDEPTGVKVCLKLTAGIKKGRGSYGSPRTSGETVSLECALQDMVGIWRVLRAREASYSIILPLPGSTLKTFEIKSQPSASDPFFAMVSEGGVSIRVPFNEGAAFAFQSVIVAVTRVLYPHLDAFAAVSLLDGGHVASAPVLSGEVSSSSDVESPSDTLEPVLSVAGDEELRPGLRKAIYAICLQTWPAKRKDVAQYIQKNATQQPAQRIVDAANSGDFSELDRIAEYLNRAD